MWHYLTYLVVIVVVRAVFNYFFAPQINAAKHAFRRWRARRKGRQTLCGRR
jgi:hypothetical protein